MNNIFFHLVISMASILFVLMAFSFGIGNAESPPLEATQSPTKKCPEKWTVVCNNDRTHCYDKKIQPDKKATSKPTKRFWTKPGKKQCLLTTKADNLGDGPFLEDFKNWLSDPKEACTEPKPDTSDSNVTMPSDLSTTTTTQSTPSTTTDRTLTLTKLKKNLTDTNVIYLSGLSRINSQIKITFLQINGDEQSQKTLISSVEVNVTNNGSFLAKWNEDTNLVKVDPDQNQAINTNVPVYLVFNRNDENKFLLTVNGKQISSENDARNFNYIQVSGDIQSIDSPVFMVNLAENYKMPKKFDANIIHNEYNVPLDSYIIFYLIVHYKSSTENKITINLGCSKLTCSKTDKSALLLSIDLKNKILDAETNEYNRGKSRRDDKWDIVEKKFNESLTTIWTIGQPVWLIIKQNQLLNDDGHGDSKYKYIVLINGENQIAIKSYNQEHFLNDFDEINNKKSSRGIKEAYRWN